MNLIILGAPGSGKGTSATVLREKFDLAHISTGDIFRANIKEQTPLGIEAKGYIDKGALVPDSVTVNMVEDRLSQDDCRKGFILDGFPRTVDQADALTKILADLGLSLKSVVNITVPSSDLVERAVGRRICKSCGATFHIKFSPSKVEGKCDECGGELYQRADDTEETMKNRLSVYEAQTKPLIDYYQKAGLYLEIDGRQAIDKVFKDMVDALKA
jgi:adenylate kinase